MILNTHAHIYKFFFVNQDLCPPKVEAEVELIYTIISECSTKFILPIDMHRLQATTYEILIKYAFF